MPSRRRTAGPGANRWVVLVVLCTSLLLVALDATVLHVAVPAVTEDLRPAAVQLLWIVDAYPLVCAALLILFGTLGDRVGRRRVLLLGYGLFGVASALAAFASTPHVLIAGPRAARRRRRDDHARDPVDPARRSSPTGASGPWPSASGARSPR